MNSTQIILSISTLLVLDFLWILLFMGKQYQTQIQTIQGTDMKLNLFMGVGAYVAMIVGLIMFVLPNIRKGHEFKDSVKYGFIFGVVLYGVYDFTNGTVFTRWNTQIALIDILWGGFVYFIASYMGTFANHNNK